MGGLNGASVLLQIAFRNLFASFLNVVIGVIIFFGTFFIVVGSSLLNSVDVAMSKSITGSVAGHIQVYSDSSKDDLAIFGNFGGFPDMAIISDFSKIKAPLLAIDNVAAVVPMGINGALVTYGNTVDLTLEKLRKAINEKKRSGGGAALNEKITSLRDHIRQILTVLQNDYKNYTALAAQGALDPQNLLVVEKAASEAFWKDFDRDPLGHLEFLENKISPLVPDADFIFLSYVGTDLEAFKKSFDRMEIADGTAIPAGQRGLLIPKYIYEAQFKLKSARRLDQVHEAIFDEGKKIALDPDLRQLIKQNRSQTREIILQLDSLSTTKVVAKLQAFLKSPELAKEKDLVKLLSQFFDINDENFLERYKFFYAEIAPFLELYRVRPGDMLAIKAFTKGGFVQSINIKVYGTFQFRGLEKSGLAGGLSLMDLMSFRDLYGFLSADKLKEIKQLEKQAGVKMVDREHAEDELFGASTASVTQAKESQINDQKELGDQKTLIKTADLINRVYSQSEIENGVVLNSAVILKDPSRLKETMKEIEAVSKRDHLNLRVASWQKAAGSIGQFVFVAKAVLFSAVFIIFIVALVIINNAVMMATLQRIREIGTMRAIGAQRGFVLAMIMVETLVLGLVFGFGGIAFGSLIMNWLHNVGIPAGNGFLYFFFSGPRLYPTLGVGNLVAALVVILIVTLISTLYPAIIATRVSPLKAMQTED